MSIQSILQRLTQARTAAGLTQSQVANMLDVSRTTVTMWESGQSPITLETFVWLCEKYGVSMTWVLTGINPSFDQEAFAAQYVGAAIDLQRVIDTLQMLPAKFEVTT